MFGHSFCIKIDWTTDILLIIVSNFTEKLFLKQVMIYLAGLSVIIAIVNIIIAKTYRVNPEYTKYLCVAEKSLKTNW